jgi:hypothetical protein
MFPITAWHHVCVTPIFIKLASLLHYKNKPHSPKVSFFEKMEWRMLCFANFSKSLLTEYRFYSAIDYLPSYRHHIAILFHPLALPLGGKKPNIARIECMVAQFVLYWHHHCS